MSAIIVYKSARSSIHSVLSARGSKGEIELAARGSKTPIFAGKVDGDGWVKPLLQGLGKGQVSKIKWQAGKEERTYFVTLDQLSKHPRIIMFDETGDILVGAGAPDEDSNASGDYQTMIEPVTGGLILGGMALLILGGLGWKALDNGGSVSVSVSGGKVSATITSNGSDGGGQLPDNGNDADNRPPLLE